MSTVLVIAPAHPHRAAWIGALAAGGHHVVVSPSLLAALPVLDDDDLAGLVFEPEGPPDLRVLGALSTARDLPPLVLMAPLTAALATRVPAARQLPVDVDGDRLCRALDDFACVRARPSRLPFRLRPEVGAQWSLRMTAAPVDVRIELDLGDGFDGATQPEGYAL